MWIFHVGGGHERRGNIVYQGDWAGLTLDDWRVRSVGWLCQRVLGAREGQEVHLLLHLAAILDRRFRGRLAQIAAAADLGFCEYSYWAAPAARAFRRAGKPLVVSAYDVLWRQVRGAGAVRFLARWAELYAMRRVASRVAVSREDQADFARHGVDTRLISHPMRLRGLQRPQLDSRPLLDALCGLPPGGGLIALFVGSRYPPNNAAAARLEAIVTELARQGGGGSQVLGVIAGGCAEPGGEGPVRRLGQVSGFVLRLLYENATVVAIPLEHGTGGSLKTIEAMAYRKAVLGTRVAFRGFDLRDGEAAVEDDLARWSERLAVLCRDGAARARLEAGAAVLAQRYELDTVFSAYLDLLPAGALPKGGVEAGPDGLAAHLDAIAVAASEHGLDDLAAAAKA